MIWHKFKVKREQALNMVPTVELRRIAKRYGCTKTGSYQIKEFLIEHWDDEIHAEIVHQIDYLMRGIQPEKRDVVRYRPAT